MAIDADPGADLSPPHLPETVTALTGRPGAKHLYFRDDGPLGNSTAKLAPHIDVKADGGYSGGTLERPGLEKLLADIERNRVDCEVVHKVDRLSRSLMDFAQFEREIIGERIRDKKLATAKQGKYVGGQPFLGYDIDREKKRLLVNPAEAEPKSQPNRPLVLALARAHRWQRMIDSGEVPGVEAIAAQHGVDRAYVSRILGLAVLAPDLTVAALKGDEPGGLSLAKLHRALPLRWDEQRSALGCIPLVSKPLRSPVAT